MIAEEQGSSLFPRTDWAELGKASGLDVACLDQLIRLYQEPLKIFLVATFPALKDQADELLVEFSEDRMLKDGWLKQADPRRGKFRHFLKTSLRNFVLDRLRSRDARHPAISIEELEHELPDAAASAEAFDLTWVRTVLAETVRRMEADCTNPAKDQPRRRQLWEMFRIRLLNPIFSNEPPVPYDQLIERFGLRSPTDASNMLLSAKRIFKAHLNRVIHEYAEQDAGAAAEIRELEEFIFRLAARG